MNTATAKKPDIKSYMGVVFVIEDNGELLTTGFACETDEASQTPPGMPEPPDENGEITCPANSSQL